jgi:Tfp pilus assembly protein PilF
MRRPFAAALVTATVVMLIGWSHLSRRQIEVWRNSETLWTAALRADPRCAMCRSNFAVTLADRGELEEAERELRTAIVLRPAFSQPRANLGSVLFELGLVSTRAGRHDDAVRYFTEAVMLLPEYPGIPRKLAEARAAASGRSD